MKRPKIVMLIGLILLFTGCTDFFMICSLNPFYLDKDIIMLPEMEGNWTALPLQGKPKESGKEEDEMDKNDIWNKADTTSVWQIERRIHKETKKTSGGQDSVVFEKLNHYTVRMAGSDADSTLFQFKMVLFKVKNVIYADFMPYDNTGLEKSRMAIESYFRIHTLARVIIRDNQPEFSWLGAEYMKDMIEKKRVRINYRWADSASRLLLTGSPEQLTGMIERYAEEPRFIDWEKQPAMLKLNRLN